MPITVVVTVPVVIAGKPLRYCRTFPDGCPDARILRELAGAKRSFGREGRLTQPDPFFGNKVPPTTVPDPTSGWAYDSPAAAVDVVTPGPPLTVLRRLKGPTLETANAG
jgi:hypothetical protein